MAGYTKLFSSIVASTIWRADNHTRLVWITLMAMADKFGVAEASVPGLADLARVTVEQCRAAIAELSSPDEDSRSKEHDGRRILAVDGGWLLVNHAKYRAKMSADDRREYLRKKQAEYRAKSKRKRKQPVNKSSDLSRMLTQSAPAPDPDPETNTKPAPKVRAQVLPESARPAWAISKPSPHSQPTNLVNGADLRRHGQHAWCSPRDGLCIPQSLHSEFIGRSGKTDAELREWYVATIAALDGAAVGEDLWTFWKNNLAAWVGVATSRPSETKTGKTMAAAKRVLAERIAKHQKDEDDAKRIQ